MNKSLIILLPVAAMGLVGCRGRGGTTTTTQTPTTGTQTTVAPTSQVGPTTPSTPTTSQRPASPYPAIQEGDGSETTPWNVTQAWNHVDKDLEECGKTSAQEQEQYIEKTPHSVRGYICYVEAISDGRDSQHPFSLKFHLADNNHYVTEDEVIAKSEAVRNGFCVYFSDTNPAIDYSPLDPTDEDDREEAYQKAVDDFTGKLVVVTGRMLNWVFEPEITSGSTFKVEK